MPDTLKPRFARSRAALAAALVAGCGGGSPFGNPPDVANPPGAATGGRLSFAYYQRCVEPIVQAVLDVDIGGEISRNSCAGSGCHDDVDGTGGAFRVVPDAAPVDLADPANTPDVIRSRAIYRNFYSAQGEALVGNADASRLLNKPLVRGVLHGGGLIFPSVADANARRIAFWINSPMASTEDEFGASAARLFENEDPVDGACLDQ